MKCFVFVLLTCNSNNDCGEDGCCFWTKSCFKKPDEGEPCSKEKSFCPCRSGLECTKYEEYNGQKFYRCSKPDITNLA
ncbi:U9-ctenitoxin-Pr1a-like isoform X2 [Orbicella faveolata]|uniref:U9-ctenitoxin-Pr1a-like isoform X2 n=1 Tax=Orbicella faveolata TaxID=48498 RepID=UPI0009E25D4B|nr:U9-ctenitoxin-Pr1a-like isoform X2 [Orbicella faveolata]